MWLAWWGHRAAMSAPRAAAQLLRMPVPLGYAFRRLIRGRGRRSAPFLPFALNTYERSHRRRLDRFVGLPTIALCSVEPSVSSYFSHWSSLSEFLGQRTVRSRLESRASTLRPITRSA